MGPNRVNFPRVIGQNPHSHGGCISLILRGGKSQLESAQNQMILDSARANNIASRDKGFVNGSDKLIVKLFL